MPELPEVEGVRRTLEPVLLGRRIADATLHTREMLAMPGDPVGGFYRAKNRKGGAAALSPKRVTRRDLLIDGVVGAIHRRGKQLAIVADDGRAVGIHLGMTGQILHAAPGAEPRFTDHIHLTWTLTRAPRRGGPERPAGRVVFRDPRRFGGIWAFPSFEALEAARWRELGPDALTVSAHELGAGLTTSRRPIKAALLDQCVVAGVGNIYADEALFLARIRPQRLASDLRPAEVERLAEAVRTVLERAVAAGGSTLRDYVDVAGQAGGYQVQHAVYGRGGRSCPECGRQLESGTVAQRTTVWCPRCQR